MGRGGAIYLSYTALVLLCAVSRASAGLWDVDIDHDPAPPPDEGPPFSAYATRNHALLPYQVVGILGAYLGTNILLGTLLLTVGRKLRKQALAMNDRPIELVQTMNNAFEGSVTRSPKSSRGWPLRRMKSSNNSVKSGNTFQSPAAESVNSFDQSVIEEHRRRDNDTMANIWGRYYADEEERQQQMYTNSAISQPTSPPAYVQRYPPRLDLDRVRAQSVDQPLTPQTPRSPYQRIDPPDFYPLSPRAGYPQSPTSADRDVRPVSGDSQQAESSISSPNRLHKGLRKTLKERGLTISPPLRLDDNSDGARTPLSPRTYIDPGRAPDPPTSWTLDSSYPLTTPGTMYDHGERPEDERDVIRDLPSAHPQRIDGYTHQPSLPSSPAPTRPELVIPPVAIDRNKVSPVSSTTNVLPFRQMKDEYRQQGAQNATQRAHGQATSAMSPGLASPGREGLMSPGPRTQFAIQTATRLYPGSALRTGPQTPYSAYMPKKLMTPVTPHFTTKAEQKQREKEDKSLRGAIAEEDQVADDKDIWGDAY